MATEPELEAFTCDLSISTFRYVPLDLKARKTQEAAYLNQLNTALLDRLQQGGEAFVSNAAPAVRWTRRKERRGADEATPLPGRDVRAT